MFSKIIKKKPALAEASPELPHEVVATWECRLQAAMGNDAELLALAIAAPSIDHKLSSVQALVSEEGLRNAEREFRKHDRRVHSLAKQRHEAHVKQRETRASAAQLIDSAATLIVAPMIPANHLAELKQSWDLLDHALIEEEHKFRFSQLQSDLTELLRERGEQKRAISRWSTAAKQALTELRSVSSGVVAVGAELQELAVSLATAREKAKATLAMMPTSSPLAEEDAALAATIQQALQDTTRIEARLMILDELKVALNAENPPGTDAVGRWRELPQMADQRTESALNALFGECLRLQDEAQQKLQKQGRLVANQKDKAALQARSQTLAAAADAAEAALAAGNLTLAEKQLAMLQSASGKGGISATIQTRIGALQAEILRLKGWQHWGGGRVRDDLVLEAEALACSTIVKEGSRPVKLPIKQIENSITQLRARWNELDRLGGATSKPLWLRFDEALKTAYLPVAAHLAQLNEARQKNLAARKNLLQALAALNIDDQPDWKEIAKALLHFQTEWRKLGPIEHTVPHKSQTALLDRMKASVARLEKPLQEVQANAQAEREQLIARAKAFGQDVRSRDMLAKLQELQSQWQMHAKSQPLPRKIENMLWAEFKATTDTLMSQRAAEFSARDAGFKTNQATREALITRLEELHQDTPPADIKRVLASVDQEWSKAGEAPRNQAEKLDSRYRTARTRAQEHIAGSARRSWQLTCDTLLAKLALCEERESFSPSADNEARWETLPPLPARWEQALQARYQSRGNNAGEALDQLLLQLESALDIPSPPAFQMARRTLKLQALKNAMEGRRTETSASQDIETMTAAAFGYTHPDPGQRSRLHSIIAALRKSDERSLLA